ncbi:PQQ-binding-like beta-propeller repeat protein [Halosegnis marinus]|uniref:outer membrane protein assembly factor BamB family protein n=1 Tax=Halosegnis marinus TaxID=3034023 RepID=UPI00360EAB73
MTAVGVGTVASVGLAGRAAASTDEWVELWELPAESPQQAPAAGDETVYVPAAGVVKAVDAETGDAAWARPVGDTVAEAGLLVDADGVVVGTETGTLRRLRASDGETVWERSLGAPVEGLTAVAGRTVVQTRDALVAVGAGGEEAWRAPLDASDGDAAVPPVAGAGVVVGSRGRTVAAVDAASGEPLWTDTRSEGDGVRALAVWEDGVVVGGATTTASLTLDRGEPLWTRETGTNALAVAGSSLYAMGPDGTDALDPASGRTERSFGVAATPAGGLTVAEIEPHGVSVVLSGTTDGTPTLVAVEADSGTEHWRLEGRGEGFGRAALADERLVVQDRERGVTVAHGEPPDEMEAPDATAASDDGNGGGGLAFDRAVAVVSVLVTIAAGLVGLAQLLHDRKQ